MRDALAGSFNQAYRGLSRSFPRLKPPTKRHRTPICFVVNLTDSRLVGVMAHGAEPEGRRAPAVPAFP
jgi:hypothetical protein